MIITVNYTDVTSKTVANSVRWSRYGTFLTEMSFVMETNPAEDSDVKAGMNAELFIDSIKVWGGIITETKELRRAKNRASISVKCKGYETIASRKVSGEIAIENKTAGEIVEEIFLTYLVNEEGFQYDSGNFDITGEILKGYYSAGAKISRLFDDLAQASGKKWWVTTDKKFCFLQSVPIIDCEKCLDLDGDSENKLKNVSDLNFASKSTDYRNVQIVFGKNNVRGVARNEEEIARIASYGGSGEYANVTINRNILTEEAATEAAVNILKSYENDSVTVNFTTSESQLELFNRIKIRATDYGYADFANFIITEIEARSLTDGKFIYEVTARYSSGSETGYRPPDGWTEQFGQLINKNDDNIQGSAGNTKGGMTPDDIIAGKSIHLEKTETSVTINAVQEALLALKCADFTENGVKYTLEDGTECTYTFGFNENGDLISLTDENGYVIEVSGI